MQYDRTAPLRVLQATWKAFNEDKAPRLASAIAYSTIFSLVPLLILCIAAGGAILGLQNGGHGHHVAEDALLSDIARHTGKQSADALRQLIAASFNKPNQSLFAQIAGWITFLFAAIGLFGTLQDALNTVWNVERTDGGFVQMLRDRLASFGMLIVLAFLLLASLGAAAMLAKMQNSLLATFLKETLMLGVMTVVFGLLFKVLPDITLRWRDVGLGAFITAILFVVGEMLITKYLTIIGIASAYGAAGSLLVILIWVYYSAMILLLGAEFTKVNAREPKTIAPSVLLSFRQAQVGVDPRRMGGFPRHEE